MTQTALFLSITALAISAVAAAFLLRAPTCMVRAAGPQPTRHDPHLAVVAAETSIRQSSSTDSTEHAIFGAGCFWGVEAAFRKVDGVVATRVGYSGGTTTAPTYEEVCAHRTGHAEVVEVVFDPARLSYEKLLQVFWANHNPTLRAFDSGSQYRSVIFTTTSEQAGIAERSRAAEESRRGARITTQIVPAAPFYEAEEYHQQYYEKSGGGSCRLLGGI
jgi:peptide-methionine (S)-S-oxide reductase